MLQKTSRLLVIVFTMLVMTAGISAAQQFLPPAYYQVSTPPDQPRALISADFNKDGAPDIAVVNTAGFAVILQNQGDGTFRTVDTFSVPKGSLSLAVGDFNEDGNPDLVDLYSSGARGSFVVFSGNGDGTFRRGAVHNVGNNPKQAAVADFNGDGHLDLAIDNSAQGGIMIFLGDGLGGFAPPTSFRGTNTPVAIAAADLNGDGIQDLVVAGVQGSLVILLNDGHATFTPSANYQAVAAPGAIAVGNLDSGGKPDLAVSSGAEGGIVVLLGNGDGTFGTPTVYPTDSVGTSPNAVVIADFNLDGKADLAVATLHGLVALLYGNGDGTFQTAVSVPTNPGTQGLVAADFDKDGAPDLATDLIQGFRVGVLLNTQ